MGIQLISKHQRTKNSVLNYNFFVRLLTFVTDDKKNGSLKLNLILKPFTQCLQILDPSKKFLSISNLSFLKKRILTKNIFIKEFSI